MKNLYAAIMILVPLLAISGTADAQSFTARLSGAQEVPPSPPLIPGGVETTASGNIAVTFSRDLSSLEFRLAVNNGVGVTAAHFHCGRAGQNGPVVVFLFASDSGIDVGGLLSEGELTNADFEASAADCDAAIGRSVNNIASLAFAARDGLIYANVHTVAFPAGEVRGQLLDKLTEESP